MANANAAENINVLIRFRPINSVEKTVRGEESHVTFARDGRSVSISDNFNATQHTFTYEKVYPPDATQEELYTRVGPSVIDAVTSGINAAVIAYGQTGSGKTYTMFGDSEASDGGLVPRILQALFYKVAHPDMEESFQASVSFIQIYREHIMDLLTPSVEHCLIREDRAHGIWITDAVVLPVATAEDALRLMDLGDTRRVVAATRANADSSRSHTVFIISILKRCLFDNTETFAQLYLVDLAGSECVEKTGSEGMRLEEAKCINTSLLALRNVIAALVHSKRHIPYRDSKITRLLQNSFGGNAKTFLVVCCSPSAYNQRETMSSLRFGDSSGRIQNRPMRNIQRSPEELTHLLQLAMEGIAAARLRVADLRTEIARQQRGPPLQVQDMDTDFDPDDIDDVTSTSKCVSASSAVPDYFICPLSRLPMAQPVIAMDGFTYDEAPLRAYLNAHQRTPLGITDTRYFPNASLRLEWDTYLRDRQHQVGA